MGPIGMRMESGEGSTMSLHRSPNIVRVIKSRRLRYAGHVARVEETRTSFKILTGTSKGRRPLGRPRHIWEENIRLDFKEIGFNTRNWLIRLRIELIRESL